MRSLACIKAYTTWPLLKKSYFLCKWFLCDHTDSEKDNNYDLSASSKFCLLNQLKGSGKHVKLSRAFYKSPVHSHLCVSSPGCCGDECVSLFSIQIVSIKGAVWKKKACAVLSLSAFALFILEQEQDKPKWRLIYFPALALSSPLTSRVVKKNSSIIHQYQSKVCVPSSVDTTHSLTHTHT